MIKKFLRIFSFICILIIGCDLQASLNDKRLKLSIIDVDYSLFYRDDNENEINDANFYDKKVMLHAPVLVEYDNKKSILFFLPPVEGSNEHRGMIFNYNLGNNKMNVVGFIHGLDDKILSVFGYEFNDEDGAILVLTRGNNFDGNVSYSTFSNSIIKEDNGLYIKQFSEDKISNPYLTNCIDGGVDYLGNERVCEYKDAASIKKYLDDTYKKKSK